MQHVTKLTFVTIKFSIHLQISKKHYLCTLKSRMRSACLVRRRPRLHSSINYQVLTTVTIPKTVTFEGTTYSVTLSFFLRTIHLTHKIHVLQHVFDKLTVSGLHISEKSSNFVGFFRK